MIRLVFDLYSRKACERVAAMTLCFRHLPSLIAYAYTLYSAIRSRRFAVDRFASLAFACAVFLLTVHMIRRGE